MEDERDSADTGSDPGGSHSGFKWSAKLRARMKKLEEWRIRPPSIISPKGARQFHGGHSIVSKAFLFDYMWGWEKSFKPREVLQLCRQSPKSDDHIRGAADDRRNAEGELDDEEKYDEEEYRSDSDRLWWGEFVALKKSRIGDNKDLERVLGLALRETEFLVELSHPNIVELKGFVEDLSKDIIWLVFSWAENGNLKDFVASRDWEIPERISLINDVAGGLEYLHSQQPPICHGDLKSFNILVNSQHVAVITDFGSARRLTEHGLKRQLGPVQTQQQPVQATFSTISKTITLSGNIYTLRWAAPELLNDNQMTLWSDIWALGWIAYEVLTNSIPFQDVPKDATVIERVIKGDLPSLHEHARVWVFQNLCSLLTMCWNTNPSERPTAKDYRRAISDMPMVAPDTMKGPHSTFSSKLSSEVLMRRGRSGRESGDSGMAFACFTEAERIYTKIGHGKGKANALECLAELYRDREEYNEAIAHFSKALQIHTEIGNTEGRASALWGLAATHRLRNEYTEVIDDRRGRASALWDLAEVCRVRNEYNAAIACYSKALQIHTDIGDKTGQASALSGLAQVHRLRYECSEAVKLYSEALQIRFDIDDSRGKADALSSLAEGYRLRNKYSEAIALYSEVLHIRTKIGDRKGRAEALWVLADTHRARHQNFSIGVWGLGPRCGQESLFHSEAQRVTRRPSSE